jgi:hypothetical protein
MGLLAGALTLDEAEERGLQLEGRRMALKRLRAPAWDAQGVPAGA